MIDVIKEAFDVKFHYKGAMRTLHKSITLVYRMFGASVWAKSMRMRIKLCFTYWLKDL